MAREPGIGRAEALRRAELWFLGSGVPEKFTDPRYWAPFSLVGEGGAEIGGAEADLQPH
jgi:CHAT domain-containing protein